MAGCAVSTILLCWKYTLFVGVGNILYLEFGEICSVPVETCSWCWFLRSTTHGFFHLWEKRAQFYLRGRCCAKDMGSLGDLTTDRGSTMRICWFSLLYADTIFCVPGIYVEFRVLFQDTNTYTSYGTTIREAYSVDTTTIYSIYSCLVLASYWTRNNFNRMT